MNKIVEKRHFSEKVVELIVEAPLIARSRRAGHFVIVRADEHGERIPLTIADADKDKGTITLVVQAVGKSSQKICSKEAGEYLHDVVGPLGQATHIGLLWRRCRSGSASAHYPCDEGSRQPCCQRVGRTYEGLDYP